MTIPKPGKAIAGLFHNPMRHSQNRLSSLCYLITGKLSAFLHSSQYIDSLFHAGYL